MSRIDSRDLRLTYLGPLALALPLLRLYCDSLVCVYWNKAFVVNKSDYAQALIFFFLPAVFSLVVWISVWKTFLRSQDRCFLTSFTLLFIPVASNAVFLILNAVMSLGPLGGSATWLTTWFFDFLPMSAVLAILALGILNNSEVYRTP